MLVAFTLIGFVGWWGTGIDDTLALGLVLSTLRDRRRTVRLALLIGNGIGVALILLAASLVTFGTLSIASGLLETRILGIPLQNLAGLLPIAIGVRALFITDDDDDAIKLSSNLRAMSVAALLGLQVYLLNSADDFALHLGILTGALHSAALTSGEASNTSLDMSAVSALIGYWFGTLIGELTSIAAAHTLAKHMQTRRILERAAAIAVIAIGVLVVFGVL